MSTAADAAEPDVQVRRDLYVLLARLLGAPPEGAELTLLSALSGDDSDLGQAIGELARAASAAQPEVAAEDFHRLFIGLGGGEIQPYASHYLTGSLHDVPLVRLREDMRRLGIRRAATNAEPEDHAATVLEIMAGLLDGSLGADGGGAAAFFDAHVAPWLPALFRDVERVSGTAFYRAVGRAGGAFMASEIVRRADSQSRPSGRFGSSRAQASA